MLKNIADYLRSVNDQRLTQEEKRNRNKEDLLFVKTLMYCNTAKTREEIFKHIEIYNNSLNFNDFIKPVIALDWLQYTIPVRLVWFYSDLKIIAFRQEIAPHPQLIIYAERLLK